MDMKSISQKLQDDIRTIMEAGLHPNQQKIDVHEPEKDKITAHDFKKLRAMKKTPDGKVHNCATHVEHAVLGKGTTVSEEHAEPDAEGNIEWYTVQFEHSTQQVLTKDLTITMSEAHMHESSEEQVDEEEKKKVVSPFDYKNYKSQIPTKPGETAGFDSKKISTGTVYSRKPVKEGSHYGNEKLANAKAGRSGTSTVRDQDGKGGVKTTTTKTPAKEAMSHQAATTMKHIPNASPALKKAAKDIKPGIAGYRDRIDMLKAGGVKEEAIIEAHTEDDIANGGTVIYKHDGNHYMAKVSHKSGSGAGTRIHVTSRPHRPIRLNQVVSTDASDWTKYKNIKEEVEMVYEANIQPTAAKSRSHIGNLSHPTTNPVAHPSSGKEIGLITKQPDGKYHAHPSSVKLSHSQGGTFDTKDQAHQHIRNAHAKAIKTGTLSDRWKKQEKLPQLAKEEVEQKEYTFAEYLEAARAQYVDEDAVLVANEAFKNQDITLFADQSQSPEA